MLIAIFNSALSIAFIAAVFWALRTLAQIRATQRLLFAEIDRITTALGIPRQEQMVRCSCGTLFAPDLTGCPHCGRAKSADARPELAPGRPI